MNISLKTVSGQLILAAGVIISVIVVGITAFNGWRTSEKVNSRILQQATDRAEWAADQVSLLVTEATSTGLALSGMIEGYIGTDQAQGAEIISMLEDVPMQFDNLFSSWMSVIPGSAASTLIHGEEGLNPAGFFTPYWTKNASGGLDFQTFEVDESQEWFAEPVRTGKSLITEPYRTNEGRLMTSVSVPVRHNGEIIGVAGVDITLAHLTDLLTNMKIFGDSRMALVDSNGKWLTHQTPERLMQLYEGVGTQEVKAALGDGQVRIIRGLPDGVTRLVYPFSANGMNRTWAMILDVPRDVFAAPVRQEVLLNVVTGVLILVLTLGTIFISSHRKVRLPLAAMLEDVNALADGNYEQDVSGTERRDEIGTMAHSLESLRQTLYANRGLEKEQQRLRDEAEQARAHRLAEEDRQREDAAERARQEQIREQQARDAKEASRQQEEAERAARAAELSRVIDFLANALQGLAEGNMDVKIAERFNAAYDPLRINFNQTVDQLSELVFSIGNATGEINDGAQQITGAISDLSRQTEGNAATLEETATALNELTASVQSAAQNAHQANTLVSETSKQAQNTSKVVEDTVMAMEEIKSSSTQISKIISVIDDIAFQTNLLALNAGVEAARAGEAGRGFAVVASEVRELAQRSSGAAREINDLIVKSGNQVLNGVEKVTTTGESLQAIFQSIATISDLIRDIAASSNEQASGISEINEAVNQIDRAQQRNAATSEETTSACTILSMQADALSDLVAKFQTGKSNPAVSSGLG
ncbi:methyl-accepting chemotaxis protein [Celeribacter neptunius]|uniref:Methyl-accepting chemotaxis protein n=1 Tax=Celeribacter neptunius TaxID=588602 RepID=A0A1I3S394_9RHOB|nr:methyl-accepting chemotaxis protein [Celeribacter neptunius]SFJ53088.1 methyl-accepting chemotaxis protein [Celeribacter neptunius]